MSFGRVIESHVPSTLFYPGLVLSAIGIIVMAHLTLYVDVWGLIWPGMIAGAGMGLFFVPLNAIAFGNIADAKLDEASGLIALMRGIGASIGIAVVSRAGVDVQSPSTMALILLEIARQAQMQALNDLFWFIGWATFAILPLVFIMTRSARKGLIVA